MNWLKRITMVAVCFSVFGLGVAHASSSTLTYQGKVTDIGGSPANGTFAVRLSLYTISSGGTPAYQETHPSIIIVDGAFAVELGSLIPFGTLFDDESTLFVELEVDLDANGFDVSEIYAPRLPVTASPYTISQSGSTFTASDAVNAMGTLGDANALNHNKYTDSDAVTAVGLGTHAANADAHHTMYTDANAISAVGLGTHTANASAHHTAYTDSDAISAVGLGTHAANGSAHHTRYADSEAVSAMSTKADGNALNHDKFALATNDVITTHIQDGAVTAAKLGSDLQVAFQVQASNAAGSIVANAATPIPFDIEILDIGNNFASGVFTVPADGTYEFHANLTKSDNAGTYGFTLVSSSGGFLNSTAIVQSQGGSRAHALHAITQLTSGDTVHCAYWLGATFSFSANSQFSTFSGRRLF